MKTHTRLHQCSAKPINGAGELDLHTVINNKWSPKEERPRTGSLASAMRCKAHPSMPAGYGNPSAIALGWPLHQQWDLKAKPLKKGKDARLLLGHKALPSCIVFCCSVRTANL